MDGRDEPDWKKLEALGIVMSAGLEEAMTYGWGNDTTLPRGWKATRPGPTLVNGKNPRDWAGVEDTEFRGTYQFLDFNSFLHYNHHRTRDTKPDLENEDEATGDCMRLMLKLLPPGQVSLASCFFVDQTVCSPRGRPRAHSCQCRPMLDRERFSTMTIATTATTTTTMMMPVSPTQVKMTFL